MDDDEYYDVDEFMLRQQSLNMSILINQDEGGVVTSKQGVSKVDTVIKDATKIKDFLGANKKGAQIKLLIKDKGEK